MQTYNFAEIQTVNGKLSFQDRLQGMLKFGFYWPKDLIAQDKFISLLQKDIDQRSTLIRDFTLPDVEITIPFILVGPPGVNVILITRELIIKPSGIYRSEEIMIIQELIIKQQAIRQLKGILTILGLIHRQQVI